MVRLNFLPYCASCRCLQDPCSSYSGFRFLHPLSVFSLKVPSFCSSQYRLFSSVDGMLKWALEKTVFSVGIAALVVGIDRVLIEAEWSLRYTSICLWSFVIYNDLSFLFIGTHNSILMELVKAVAHRGSISPESIAVTADQKSHSYHQLILSARKISSNLLTGANLHSVKGSGENKHLGGARVGIVAKPSPEFVAGVLGTWFSGGVAVPLALSYPEAELLHVMNDSDITMILSTEDHQELMKAVAAKTSAQMSLLPSVPSVSTKSTELDHTRNGELDGTRCLQETEIPHEISGDDPALIIYTSGTTGKPKGVVHTHKGVLAQWDPLTRVPLSVLSIGSNADRCLGIHIH
ncbi:Malonate--CoA ligase [Sesamum angolense]|uniref:Malonate--CoA ligase n=1 Tax=Sesamum angolense TaxID=2727404 RepID=A0AAE1WL63_9LAMI|nr:Malonate--CoA ligase [Sesamum angolense]